MIGLTPLRPQPQAWLWGSVLSPFAERYCEYLLERGYAPSTVNRYVRCVAHFAHWIAKRRIPAAGVDHLLVHSFVTYHLPHCSCPDPIPRNAVDVRAALQHLLVVLGARAVPWFLRDEPDAIRDEVCRFIQHLECVFHTKLDSDFAPSWTGISREGGHGFHGKLDSDFTRSWTVAA